MENDKIELMTWKEYFHSVNEEGKMHDENAYNNTTLEDYKSDLSFDTLERQFTSHGIQFEIKKSTVDRWAFEYAKIDDSNNPVLDSKGKPVQLTREEKKEKILPRFEYEHAIVEKRTNNIVAKTQDEWNCLLISVANEYKGLNLGEELLEHHRTTYPFRYSGGHTPQGKEALYRIYQNKISKFLANGDYSKEVKNGTLTTEKAKKIINSASIGKEYMEERNKELNKYDISEETHKERLKRQKDKSDNNDYNMFKAEDILLHVDNNFAILYNKKAFNKINSVNDNDYFTEQGLLGYAYIGGVYDNSTPKLFRLFGQNDEIKKYMAEVILNQYVGDPVKIFDNDLHLLNDNIKNNSLEGFKRDEMTDFTLQNKTMDNIDMLSFIEKKFRKENDQYDEKWILVHEQVTAFAEDYVEELHKKIKNKKKFN
jgi:hypothetical protein